jgi:hypothetical protein
MPESNDELTEPAELPNEFKAKLAELKGQLDRTAHAVQGLGQQGSQLSRPQVSRITIGRLYNLGNYEHIRYELSVEIPEGGDVTKAFKRCAAILKALNPKNVEAFYIRQAKALLAKPEAELSEYERGEVSNARDLLAKDTARRARRATALDLLSDLGGTVVKTDAKERWEEWDGFDVMEEEQ